MSQENELTQALEKLSLPETRTTEPVVIVAVGQEEYTSAFFDCLREFFPLVYVSKGILEDIPKLLLFELCLHLVDSRLCPYLSVSDLTPPLVLELPGRGMQIHLLWVADCSGNWPSRAGADRLEWFKSVLDVSQYYVVDASQDFYSQVYSLPFLPGERR